MNGMLLHDPGTPADQQDRQSAYRHKLGEREPSGMNAGAAPSAPSLSPFNGIGVFTAHDPNAASGLKADWIAVQLDPEGGIWKDDEQKVDEARKHFGKVFGWQARPSLIGVLDARRLKLDGYIAQAENATEYEAALSLGKIPGLAHALVGSCGDWWDGKRVAEHGYDLILEAYECSDPGVLDRLDSKGYPVASVLFGCYDASGERPGVGRRVPLSEYLARYPTANWSVYLAETLMAEDRAVLA